MNEILTSPVLTEPSVARFIDFEGKIPHFYLDGPGNVTIGIGCLIPDAGAASKLQMFSKDTNLKVTDLAIIDEYKMVRMSLPGKFHCYYANITHLYLSDNDIFKIFFFRIATLQDNLRKQIPEFSNLPAPVKEVVVDMAFDLGISGLLNKFPKFVDAIRNKRFSVAAQECLRINIQPRRNDWAKDTLLGVL